MNIQKLREIKPDELKQRLQEKMQELATIKYEVKMNQEKNYKKIGLLRKEIARINTLLKL